MTKKTIAELTSISDTQKSTALVAIEQDGATFNAPVRPNPPNQRNYTLQSQLEADFGTNIIVDVDNLTFFFDASFTLSKPIKIAAGIKLEVTASVGGNTVSYSGAVGLGPLFQPEVADTAIGGLKITNVDFQGTTLNDFINIKTGANQSVILEGVNLTAFNDLGIMEATFVSMSNVASFAYKIGFKIKNYLLATLNTVVAVQQTSNVNPTYVSFIAPTTPSVVNIDGLDLQDLAGGDTLVFFDPNAVAGSSYQIVDSNILAGTIFYQQGSDIAVDSTDIGTSGSGFTNFTTAAPHGLRVGKVIVNSGFGDTINNGTFVVTSVDMPVTGTVYEVKVLFDGSTDTGNLNAASLDSTNTIVNAVNNPDADDSMSTISVELAPVSPNPVVVTIIASNTPTKIVSVDYNDTDAERMLRQGTDGQIVVTDLKTRTYRVNISAIVESTAASQTLGIRLVKNMDGTPVILGNAFPDALLSNNAFSFITQDYLVELATGETLNLAAINVNSVTNMEIQFSRTIVSRA